MCCTRAPEGVAAERAAALGALLPAPGTARLRLVAPTLAHLPLWTCLMAEDDGSMGGPLTTEAAWEAFCVYVAGWQLHGHGLWAVEAADDGAHVGFVLVGLEWGDREPELGYMIAPAYRGRGFGAEAARAARDWAFGDGWLDALVSYVSPENRASAGVARALGAIAETDPELPETIVFRHHPAAKGPEARQ